MKLCIVVPAYNAARTLPQVLRRIREARPEGLASVVVVDDGSADDTAGVARALAADWPAVSVIVRARNGG